MPATEAKPRQAADTHGGGDDDAAARWADAFHDRRDTCMPAHAHSCNHAWRNAHAHGHARRCMCACMQMPHVIMHAYICMHTYARPCRLRIWSQQLWGGQPSGRLPP
eukprot:362535-Chlamydomonas_euryale.AAC.2